MHKSTDLPRTLMAGALLALLNPATAWAQAEPTICVGVAAVNIDTCSLAVDASAEMRRAEVAEEAHDQAARLNTGPSGVAAASGASTTNDYIPFIQALLGTSPSGAEGDNLGLEFSNFLPIPDGIQHKFAVQLLGAELYQPLGEALKEAGFNTEKDDFDDQVGSNDDISVTISLSRATKESGRSPALHADLFYKLLAASVPQITQSRKAAANFLAVFDDAKVRQPGLTQAMLVQPGFEAVTDDADRNAIIAAYEQKAIADRGELLQIRDNLRRSGFYDALELISNNAQWSFMTNYRFRDELSGPDEWSLSAKYEIGWPNLSQAKKQLNCSDDACLADKLNTFLKTSSRSRNASPRFAFNLSYSERASYEFTLPTTMFEFRQKSARSLIGDISYGMFLSGTPGDPARLRLDFTASYEDVSDDPAKNDRGVANLTFTYPLANGTFLSLGAVYATKPEFRGEVDKEINARAGLLYKFAGSKP